MSSQTTHTFTCDRCGVKFIPPGDHLEWWEARNAAQVAGWQTKGLSKNEDLCSQCNPKHTAPTRAEVAK